MKRSPLLAAAVIAALSCATSSAHARPIRTAHVLDPHPMAASATAETSATSTIACIDVRTGVAVEFHARHLLASGQVDSSWTPEGAQLCSGSGQGLGRPVVSDGTGGTFVGWVDSRRGDPDIYLQRFASSGSIAQGWPAEGRAICQATRSQYQLDLLPDGGGGVYAAWQDYREAESGIAYITHVTATGVVAAGWPEGGRPVSSRRSEQAAPRLARDGSGGVFVVWQDRHSGRLNLLVQHLTTNGEPAPGWPSEGAALAAGEETEDAVSISGDAEGHTLIVWRSQSAAGNQSVRASRLDPGFVPTPEWNITTLTLAAATGELTEPTVVPGGQGSALVVWREIAGDIATLRAQRLPFTGAFTVAWTAGGAAICQGAIGRGATVVLPDTTGGGIVAWKDFRSDSSSAIYAQRLTSGGVIAQGWSASGTAVFSGGHSYAPALTSDGAGGALITWSEPSNRASASVLALTQLLSDGLPHLSESIATPAHAHILWRVRRGLRDSLEVERRLTGAQWLLLLRVAPDDSGKVVVDDRSAPQGARIEYRIAVSIEGAKLYSETVALDIPLAPIALGLNWARAEASRGIIHVSLSLPAGPAATLQLMDVAGRRLAAQVLADLEPGEHELSFAVPRLPAGVYFVRVTQGSQSRVGKTLVLR